MPNDYSSWVCDSSWAFHDTIILNNGTLNLASCDPLYGSALLHQAL